MPFLGEQGHYTSCPTIWQRLQHTLWRPAESDRVGRAVSGFRGQWHMPHLHLPLLRFRSVGHARAKYQLLEEPDCDPPDAVEKEQYRSVRGDIGQDSHDSAGACGRVGNPDDGKHGFRHRQALQNEQPIDRELDLLEQVVTW